MIRLMGMSMSLTKNPIKPMMSSLLKLLWTDPCISLNKMSMLLFILSSLADLVAEVQSHTEDPTVTTPEPHWPPPCWQCSWPPWCPSAQRAWPHAGVSLDTISSFLPRAMTSLARRKRVELILNKSWPGEVVSHSHRVEQKSISKWAWWWPGPRPSPSPDPQSHRSICNQNSHNTIWYP